MTGSFEPSLLDALESTTIDRIEGVVWRQVLAPTSVVRTNQRGSRWNPPGREALYCSVDPATAAAEIDNLLASQPVPITRERYTYALDVRLTRVADVRTDFGYDFDLNDEAACRSVGAAAAWLEMGGILVPSLRTNGVNLVIFVANLAAADHFEAGDRYVYPPGPAPTDLTSPPIVT